MTQGYRYEVTSVEGLIQQLVVHLRNGYWFYAQGRVPEAKRVDLVDEKLLDKYDIRLSKYQRARRKALGRYNVQYLRFGRTWFLLATHGLHPRDKPGKPAEENFHHAERKNIRDARKCSLRVEGYSLSYRRSKDGKFHVLVSIDNTSYKELRDYLVSAASKRSLGWCVCQIWNTPYEPYEPVRNQLRTIVRQMNERRKRAGKEVIPYKFIPWKRKIVRPFEAMPIVNELIGMV